jgi:hypothetical protein
MLCLILDPMPVLMLRQGNFAQEFPECAAEMGDVRAERALLSFSPHDILHSLHASSFYLDPRFNQVPKLLSSVSCRTRLCDRHQNDEWGNIHTKSER